MTVAKPPIVEVEWLDSVVSVGWRQRGERLQETEAANMRHASAGYLLRSSKTDVVITHSRGVSLDNVAETIQIPRRAVVSIRKLT